MKEQCINHASIRRFWPGKKPDLVCVAHFEDSKRVAVAMGFDAHFEPFGINFNQTPLDEWPRCCCSKGFSESVAVKENVMKFTIEVEITEKQKEVLLKRYSCLGLTDVKTLQEVTDTLILACRKSLEDKGVSK